MLGLSFRFGNQRGEVKWARMSRAEVFGSQRSCRVRMSSPHGQTRFLWEMTDLRKDFDHRKTLDETVFYFAFSPRRTKRNRITIMRLPSDFMFSLF